MMLRPSCQYPSALAGTFEAQRKVSQAWLQPQSSIQMVFSRVVAPRHSRTAGHVHEDVYVPADRDDYAKTKMTPIDCKASVFRLTLCVPIFVQNILVPSGPKDS